MAPPPHKLALAQQAAKEDGAVVMGAIDSLWMQRLFPTKDAAKRGQVAPLPPVLESVIAQICPPR